MYNYKPHTYEENLVLRKRLEQSIELLKTDNPSIKADALAELMLSSGEMIRNDIIGFIAYASKNAKMSHVLTVSLKEIVQILTDCDHTHNRAAVELSLGSELGDLIWNAKKYTHIPSEEFYGNYSNQFNVLTSKLGVRTTAKIMRMFSELKWHI